MTEIIDSSPRDRLDWVDHDLHSSNIQQRWAAEHYLGKTKTKQNFDYTIKSLSDDDPDVRSAAHRVLVKLNKGIDLGPTDGADESERLAAIDQWKKWWDEETYDGKLRLAKMVLAKKPERARSRLQEIIDKAPHSAAAQEAARLLKQIE